MVAARLHVALAPDMGTPAEAATAVGSTLLPKLEPKWLRPVLNDAAN